MEPGRMPRGERRTRQLATVFKGYGGTGGVADATTRCVPTCHRHGGQLLSSDGNGVRT